MPSHDIQFCSKEGNACPKRFKCYRYMAKHQPEDMVWYGDNWDVFGKGCELFKPMREEIQ